MAQIAVQPLILKDMILTIGTDSYEKHVSGVLIEPQTTKKTWRGGTPSATFSDVSIDSWTCRLDYVQDWETTNSLSDYLLDNAGETKAAVITPASGVGQKFSVNIGIIPGPIGGKVGDYTNSSVTLGCDEPVASAVS